MKRVGILIISLIALPIFAADTKFSELDTTNALTNDDLFPIVDAPAGTPGNFTIPWSYIRARANHTGTQTLSTISDAGTAAAANVPASGNAASGEVVKGSDTRLSDSRAPSGVAGGDLTGTFPNPTFAGPVEYKTNSITTLASSAVTNYAAVLSAVGGNFQVINTGNTNANISFSSIALGKSVTLLIDAATSSVPCVVKFPVNVRTNGGLILTVTNGTLRAYNLLALGTNATDVIVTGGDFYDGEALIGGDPGEGASASDNFNRADAGTLGDDWTAATATAIGITNNEATLTALNNDAIALRSAESFSDDHSAQVTFTATGGKVGVVVRGSGSGGSFNGYVVNAAETGSYVLGKFTSGSYSTIETFSATAVLNESVKLKIVGTTLTIYTNGVVADSTTDATFSTGAPGIILWSSDDYATADDFEASDEE